MAALHLSRSSVPLHHLLRSTPQKCLSTTSSSARPRLESLRSYLKSEPSPLFPPLLKTHLLPQSDTIPSPDSYSFHLKTYGCQMNVADSSIVRSVLLNSSSPLFHEVDDENAEISLTNTCAIRDNAEKKVWNRMYSLRSKEKNKKVEKPQILALLGCMSERLKSTIFEDKKAKVDVIVGPDAYKDLPRLLSNVLNHQERGCNTELSFTETYDDVLPVRGKDSITESYISIMRGCNNMCSYCVVPFTRGRERSKGLDLIVEDFKRLTGEGVKEITLLGQNVNSYHDRASLGGVYETSNPGFKNMYNLRGGGGMYFSDLMDAVSRIDENVRIRFTSPHPKDFPEHLFDLISERVNLCNSIHMPAQSGSDTVLERMRRGYDRDSYIRVVESARSKIPGVTLSSDFITGFCGETEEEHIKTLELMEKVRYDHAFMFKYSMRGKTHAHRKMVDDVEESVKGRRLEEVIEVFRRNVQEKNEEEELGEERVVLVEGEAKRSTKEKRQITGRTDGNKRVVWDDTKERNVGEYVKVRINDVRGHTLRGEEVGRCDIRGNLE